MNIKINFDEIYNQIKFRKRVLTSKEIINFSKLLERNYDEDLFHGAILCISLGSKYLEENPYWVKQFFNYSLNDYDKSALFDSLSYANITKYYLEELLDYLDIKKALNGKEMSCSSALHTLGQYVYLTKDQKIYKKILDENHLSVKVYIEKEKIHEENLEDYEFYLKACYQSLLFSTEGPKSYQGAITLNEIIKNIPLAPRLGNKK